jgi:hypothetical protein
MNGMDRTASLAVELTEALPPYPRDLSLGATSSWSLGILFASGIRCVGACDRSVWRMASNDNLLGSRPALACGPSGSPEPFARRTLRRLKPCGLKNTMCVSEPIGPVPTIEKGRKRTGTSNRICWWPQRGKSRGYGGRAPVSSTAGAEPFARRTLRRLKPCGLKNTMCVSEPIGPMPTIEKGRKRTGTCNRICWWPQRGKSRGYGGRATVSSTAGAAVRAFDSLRNLMGSRI